MNKCLECNNVTDNPRFCSLSCSSRNQRKNAPRKDKSKICNNCKNSFKYLTDPQQKFCSKSCSATFNNKKRGVRKDYCAFCKSLIVNRKSGARKFCSKLCNGSYLKQATINSWIENPGSATRQQGLAPSIKRYLISLVGEKCTLCGWNETNSVTGRVPLEVDHIDGDCYNNNPENLIVLCPNCHSLTSTYRALNRNSKRKYRSSK